MVLSKKRARKVLAEIIALFPDAKPSLDFTNHFELLVAVMLSAQTTDAAVNKVTPASSSAVKTLMGMFSRILSDTLSARSSSPFSIGKTKSSSKTSCLAGWLRLP